MIISDDSLQLLIKIFFVPAFYVIGVFVCFIPAVKLNLKMEFKKKMNKVSIHHFKKIVISILD